MNHPLAGVRHLLGSIRIRLAALALVIVTPMLVLLCTGADFERQHTLQVTRTRMLELARLAAEQQNDVVQDAKALLRLLAQVPVVASVVPGLCHDLLQGAAGDHPSISLLTVTDRFGQAVCNSRDRQPNYNLTDRGYFRELMRPDPPTFALSELLMGRRVGRPVIIAAVPLAGRQENGTPTGIALATLNFDWFTRLGRLLPMTEPHSIVLLDRQDGALLASSAPSFEQIGLQFPQHSLVKAMQARPQGGDVEAADFAGVPHIFGFVPLSDTHGQIMVAVGVSRDVVLDAANRRFKMQLGLALAVAVVAVLIGYVAAHVWLIRPIRRISTAVEQFGHNASGRIAVADMGVSELRNLAVSFNAMTDIIQRQNFEVAEVHEALIVSEEHHRALADNVTDMITRFDIDFIRIYVSPGCRNLLGYEPDELTGRSPGSIVHPADWPLLDASLNAPLRQGAETAQASYRAFRKDGTEVWLDSRGRRLANGSGFVVVTTDITVRKRFEAALEDANAQLEIFARQDALTGLANRRRLDEALLSEWQRAAREGTSIGFLLIDVDRFKSYNDSFGHSAGDDCLRRVSDAVRATVRRPGDLAARYGGEELAVLLPNTGREGALFLAEQITQAIRALRISHPSNGGGVVTVSIGVCAAMARPLGDRVEELVSRADAALYAAKSSGRDMVCMAPEIQSSTAIRTVADEQASRLT